MSFSPFTKQQLMPQEETLEVGRHKSQLFIGIPKETSCQERRICLTPDAVASLTLHGHRVLIESGAGLSSSYCDREYSEAGAEITTDTKKVLSCPLLLKVEPLTLEEIEHVAINAVIISAIQIKTRQQRDELIFRFRICGVQAFFSDGLLGDTLLFHLDGERMLKREILHTDHLRIRESYADSSCRQFGEILGRRDAIAEKYMFIRFMASWIIDATIERKIVSKLQKCKVVFK